MTRLGILVGEDKWMFFKEIFDDLAAIYPTEVYRRKTYDTPLLSGRLNSWAFRHGLSSMMRRNDICFFEWAGELLAHASHMPRRCRIVTRLHSFELFEWAPRVDWANVDKVILVSRAMQRRFCSLHPDHAPKTEVVHNGRSMDLFKPPAQRSFNANLGMLCSILPIKRIYEVILLMRALKERGYSAHLHIGGKPEDLRYGAAVCSLVEKLKLGGSVTFHGFVVDVASWLREIDIYVSNSYWEGQSVALIEAMASGCYCLSHFWDGADEMLPPENLYATEAELLQKIIAHFEMSEAERQNCRASLRAIACSQFDIESAKDKIRHIIRSLQTDPWTSHLQPGSP